MYYNMSLGRIRLTIVAVEKQFEILNILSVCLYSCLSFPTCKMHASCLLSSVARLILPHLFTLFHKRNGFRKKGLLDMKRVF